MLICVVCMLIIMRFTYVVIFNLIILHIGGPLFSEDLLYGGSGSVVFPTFRS